MRKINFLNGLNTKVALMAVALVSGFTFTSCEKEDFDVNPTVGGGGTVIIPTTPKNQAKVVVAYSVKNNVKGVNVTVTQDGSEVNFTNGSLTLTAAQDATLPASTFVFTAEADGYYPTVVTITTPEAAPGEYYYVPVVLDLDKVVLSENDVRQEPANTGTEPGQNEATIETSITNDSNEPKLMNVSVAINTGSALTEEDAAAAIAAIDALTGPSSRAAEDDIDLKTAKANLKAWVVENSTFATAPHTFENVTIPAKATKVEAKVEYKTEAAERYIYTIVNEKRYEVIVKVTTIKSAFLTLTATLDNGHSSNIGHGHDHGNGNNAGGGSAN